MTEKTIYKGIELPSNKKFGTTFFFIFLIISLYFYIHHQFFYSSFFILLSIVFILLALFKPSILLPLNKVWMSFGLLLGKFVSPIVLGLIFFCIFTPLAILMRLAKRDELKIKNQNKISYWSKVDDKNKIGSNFDKQF